MNGFFFCSLLIFISIGWLIILVKLFIRRVPSRLEKPCYTFLSMNQCTRFFITLFGLLFVLFFLGSIQSIVKLSEIKPEEKPQEHPAYHFALFLPEERYSFFDLISEGAEAGGDKYNAAVSLHPIREGAQDLDHAVFSGIDGVILYPNQDEERVRDTLYKLSAADISVVMVEHSISDDAPWPFVGTNTFEIGKKVGGQLENRETAIEAAVIYSKKSPGILAERDLFSLGLRAALSSRQSLHMREVITSLNPLDAEALTYQMLKSDERIDTIILTDPRDSLAAAQVLVDMNLVGTVQLIGYGSDPALLDYVEKEVVSATVVTEAWDIGFFAVKTLVELRESGNAASYIDTGVQIVDAESVALFRRSRSAQ